MKNDFSLRTDYSERMVINNRLDYLKNLTSVIFGMRKGYDRYNPKMGLDLPAKRHAVINSSNGRDPEYEQEIKEQFSRYLGINVYRPVAAFGRGRYIVTFSVIADDGNAYQFRVSSGESSSGSTSDSKSDLSVLVVNQEIEQNL